MISWIIFGLTVMQKQAITAALIITGVALLFFAVTTTKPLAVTVLFAAVGGAVVAMGLVIHPYIIN